MKAGFVSAAALSLATVAVAQPHQIRHVHQHVAKRDDVVTQTNIVYHTVETEEIVVFVEDGKTIATSTFWSAATTPTSAPAVETSSVTVAAIPAAATSAAAVEHAQVPASSGSGSSSGDSSKSQSGSSSGDSSKAQSGSSSGSGSGSGSGSWSGSSSGSGSSSSSNSNSGSDSSSTGANDGSVGFGYGISYSPYQANHDCKSVEQIAQDLKSLDGYSVVRLYGTDCNQVGNTLQAAKGKNMQIFAGVFDLNNWAAETGLIIEAVKEHAGGNWGVINTVNIGNELVNDGSASVGQVASAVKGARAMLRAAGYKGPVVTVDTMVAHKNNPGLCEASDYCAMNCHAFFDGGVAASGAGEFVLGWVQQIASMQSGKQVIITESGWPWGGETNGKAVASPQEQQTAISSLRSAFSSNIVLYSAYNDLWKTSNAAQFGAEQSWGMYGDAPA